MEKVRLLDELLEPRHPCFIDVGPTGKVGDCLIRLRLSKIARKAYNDEMMGLGLEGALEFIFL